MKKLKKINARPRGGKSKLGRSVVVTMRLDERLRYLVDLAARKQRRTASSFLEWAAEKALDAVPLGDGKDKDHTVGGWASYLWNVDPIQRFITLGFEFRDLMTFEEQELWSLIQNNGYLWRGNYNADGEYRWSTTVNHRGDLHVDRLKETWDKFKAVAEGKADPSTLPKWDKTKKVEK